MNKNINVLILKTLFPILFNVLFFTLSDFKHEISAWLGYGFIHLAYVILIFAGKLEPDDDQKALFRMTNYFITFIFFMITLGVGIVWIFVGNNDYLLPFLVHFVILIIFIAFVLVNNQANKHTSNDNRQKAQKISVLKNFAEKLDEVIRHDTNHQIKHRLSRIYDKIKYLPISSHERIINNVVIAELIDSIYRAYQQNDFELLESSVLKLEKQL